MIGTWMGDLQGILVLSARLAMEKKSTKKGMIIFPQDGTCPWSAQLREMFIIDW